MNPPIYDHVSNIILDQILTVLNYEIQNSCPSYPYTFSSVDRTNQISKEMSQVYYDSKCVGLLPGSNSCFLLQDNDRKYCFSISAIQKENLKIASFLLGSRGPTRPSSTSRSNKPYVKINILCTDILNRKKSLSTLLSIISIIYAKYENVQCVKSDTNVASGSILTKLKFIRDAPIIESGHVATKLDTRNWTVDELILKFLNIVCGDQQKIYKIKRDISTSQLLQVYLTKQQKDLEKIYMEYVKSALSNNSNILDWIIHQITNSTSFKDIILNEVYIYGSDKNILEEQLKQIYETNQIFEQIENIEFKKLLKQKIENNEIEPDDIEVFALIINSLVKSDQGYLLWLLKHMIDYDSEIGNQIFTVIYNNPKNVNSLKQNLMNKDGFYKIYKNDTGSV